MFCTAYCEELEMFITLKSIPHIKSLKMEETRGLYLYSLMSYAYLYDALFLGFLTHKAYWEELEMYSTLTSIAFIKSFKTEETRGLYPYLLMSYAYLYDAAPL